MKLLHRLLAALPCVLLSSLFAQDVSVPADDAVQAEVNVIASAHSAAAADNDDGVEQVLTAPPKIAGARSVALARRAVAVCGWLQSENQYGRAMRVARRVLRRLAVLSEDNDADRIERGYWEAWLESEVLDHKARAAEILDAAHALAPDDERILQLQLRVAGALSAAAEAQTE